MKYAEVPLSDSALRISGHSDGLVVGIDSPFLIEIKSVGAGTIRQEASELLAANNGDLNKAWRDIRRPFPSHIRQGQLYLELIRRMSESGNYPEELPTEIVFIYELKADQSYKEFVVQANSSVIDEYLDKAAAVVHAVSVGEIPDCSVNPGEGCKMCLQFEEEK